jgi:hypothetical protein
MVNKAEIDGIADFYRKVWALGTAGVEVPLSILRGARIQNITVQSADRYTFLQQKSKRKGKIRSPSLRRESPVPSRYGKTDKNDGVRFQ